MTTLRMMMLTAALSYGCGGGDNGTPTTPTQPNNPTPVATTTITITAAGVTPQVITVSAGSRVTFVNNDSRSHEMHSDPHPQHGECPAIDEVGFLPAGGTKQTGVFSAARTCGFHDHNLPDVASLRGRIVVQ